MRFLIGLIFLLIAEKVFSQQSISDILNTKTEYITRFSVNDLEDFQYYLPSAFASEKLIADSMFAQVRNQLITRVELVYTTFRESEAFNQTELNRNRLLELQKLAPELFQNNLTEWRQVAVTGAGSSAEGKEVFHGFIITYRPNPKKENTLKEIDYLKSVIGDTSKTAELFMKKTARSYKRMPVYRELFYDNMEWPVFPGRDSALNNYLKKHFRFSKDDITSKRSGMLNIQFTVDKQGRITDVKINKGVNQKINEQTIKMFEQLPLWKPGTRNRKPAPVDVSVSVYFDAASKSVYIDSLPLTPFKDYRPHARNKEVRVDSVDATDLYVRHMEERDSLVFKVIERNKWTNLIMICDVTGSMTPYTSQLLLWLKQNISKNRIKHFVFFNDGDQTPDNQKVTGKTGGIYPVTSNVFNDITATMFKCMEAGNGGDIPENNIEAALEAIRLFPECDTVVMIADNFATPGDMELLSKLKKPLKIILCGTYAGINTNYLDLVRVNRGSLHIIEEDIRHLERLKNNEVVEVNGIRYQLDRGRFKRVK